MANPIKRQILDFGCLCDRTVFEKNQNHEHMYGHVHALVQVAVAVHVQVHENGHRNGHGHGVLYIKKYAPPPPPQEKIGQCLLRGKT
jgi:hypothetical protein